MSKAGIQPITTASLPEPKMSPVPGMKTKRPPSNKPNNKALAALFGKKNTKPTIQGVPTKVPSF